MRGGIIEIITTCAIWIINTSVGYRFTGKKILDYGDKWKDVEFVLGGPSEKRTL